MTETIYSLSVGSMSALLTDGSTAPIAAIYDSDGDQTSDPAAAHYAEISAGSRTYIVSVRDYTGPTRQ